MHEVHTLRPFHHKLSTEKQHTVGRIYVNKIRGDTKRNGGGGLGEGHRVSAGWGTEIQFGKGKRCREGWWDGFPTGDCCSPVAPETLKWSGLQYVQLTTKTIFMLKVFHGKKMAKSASGCLFYGILSGYKNGVSDAYVIECDTLMTMLNAHSIHTHTQSTHQ